MSEIKNDPYADNLATDIFKFSNDQFVALRQANFAAVLVALVCSITVMSFYSYMFAYHRKEANRVSLRCVFLCCLSDILNDVMNIVSNRIRGESPFCSAASILIEFSNIWTASLLTLVGINLVLIFVVNVKRRDLLEKFYYPSVLIYSLVAQSVSIYTDATSKESDDAPFSCWYQVYIEDRSHDFFSWMWFYGCIFFVNVIAIVCSITAMIKLLHEHKQLEKKMNNIALQSSFTSRDNERLDKSLKKKRNAIFTTVVVRCILYPLVPFLVNIFGFIIQLSITINTTHSSPFALSMLDIILSNFGGILVSIIFFTDPAVTSVIKLIYAGWLEKFVEEYTLVQKSEVKKYLEPATTNTVDSSPSDCPADSSSIAENNSSAFVQSPSPAIITETNRYFRSKANVYNNIYELNSSKDGVISVDPKSKDQRTVPLRRQLIQTPDLNSKKNDRRSGSMRGSSIITLTPVISRSSQIPEVQSTNTVREVYIPYRFPRLATCVHHTFKMFGVKKRKPTLIAATNTNNILSTDETCYNSDDDSDLITPYKVDTTAGIIPPLTEEEVDQTGFESDSTSSNKNTIYY